MIACTVADGPHRNGQQQDPEVIHAAHHEKGETQCDQGDAGVGHDDQLLPVHPIGQDTGEDRNDTLGQEGGHRVEGHRRT
jgi:hypothetical protein